VKGFIQKIKVYKEKGSAGLELTEGQLIENRGLEGDYYAKGGDRQISLLFGDSYIKDQSVSGFCVSRFKENLRLRFLEPAQIQAGTRFELNDAVLEITAETKRCYAECPLYMAGKSCQLANLNLFAKVVKGGTIRAGDSVLVV